MAIYVGENNALLLKDDRSVVEFYKGNKKMFGYNNSVQGEMIRVNNANPTEHKLKVKLSSDTINDFSDITVTRCGKNLFDGSIKRGFALTGTGNNRTVKSNVNDGYKIIKVKPSTTYCISGDFLFISDNTMRVASFSEFPTVNAVSNRFAYKSRTAFTITTTANCNYLFFWFIVPSKTNNIDIQVEEGTETEFEAYNGQTLSANADGTVEGLMSLSPNMTIFSDSDDAMIHLSYC